MKKILYVITKANWGGAQRYVFDLATAARARGHEVAVVYGSSGLLVERLNASGIRTIAIPELGRDIDFIKDIKAYFALLKLFKQEAPQVVHLNSSKAAALGARAAHSAHVQTIVFTAHGWAFTEPRSLLSRTIFLWLQKYTVHLATHVIAVSHAVRASAKKWGIPIDKIRVIPLGVAEPLYLSKQDARNALIQKDPSLAPQQGALWVGTIAELHKNKGIDIGITAWSGLSKQTPKSCWVVIGDGDERVALAMQATETKNIYFLGFMPDAAQYMRAFDLFLLPSRTEALAYVIIEAGMAGVPVIASDVGGIRESSGSTRYPQGTLFEAENAGSLQVVLHAYLEQPQLLPKASTALHEHVTKSFSLQQMVAQTLAVYE